VGETWGTPPEEDTLAPEVQSAAEFSFIREVEQACEGLMAMACADPERGLGGKLLYAGELDREGRALLVAANIAGAASLSATAERTAQKQAVRDGIADFLVNSLDEALRILKNQLRKREAVAVCVGLAPEAVEREMRERGVLPDLERDAAEGLGGGLIAKDGDVSGSALVTWNVAAAPAQWLPKLDALATECLEENAWRERRWLRLAPRYLGRLAQGLRLLRCDGPSAARFVEQVRQRAAKGEIAVAVEIKVRDAAGDEREWRVEPLGAAGAN
jgi:urocanase-like protein